MRRIVYQGMLRLPFRIGAAAGGAFGFVGSVWPERVRSVIGAGITADQIQIAGVALLVLGIIYFAALWLLKPGGKDEAATGGTTQTTYGPQSPSIGTNYGLVQIGPSPAATQPTKSPYGTGSSPYDIKAFEGLARTLHAGKSDLDRALDRYSDPAWSVDDEVAFRTRRSEPLRPNLPLNGLLARVYKHMGGAPNEPAIRERFYRRVNLEIMDKATQCGLHLWGRIGDYPLRQIQTASLKFAKLNHRRGELRIHSDGPAIIYNDLHFCETEINAVWPRQPRTTNDGKP